MAAFDFPENPTNGMEFSPEGSSLVYTYSAASNSWSGVVPDTLPQYYLPLTGGQLVGPLDLGPSGTVNSTFKTDGSAEVVGLKVTGLSGSDTANLSVTADGVLVRGGSSGGGGDTTWTSAGGNLYPIDLSDTFKLGTNAPSAPAFEVTPDGFVNIVGSAQPYIQMGYGSPNASAHAIQWDSQTIAIKADINGDGSGAASGTGRIYFNVYTTTVGNFQPDGNFQVGGDLPNTPNITLGADGTITTVNGTAFGNIDAASNPTGVVSISGNQYYAHQVKVGTTCNFITKWNGSTLVGGDPIGDKPNIYLNATGKLTALEGIISVPDAGAAGTPAFSVVKQVDDAANLTIDQTGVLTAKNIYISSLAGNAESTGAAITADGRIVRGDGGGGVASPWLEVGNLLYPGETNDTVIVGGDSVETGKVILTPSGDVTAVNDINLGRNLVFSTAGDITILDDTTESFQIKDAAGVQVLTVDTDSGAQNITFLVKSVHNAIAEFRDTVNFPIAGTNINLLKNTAVALKVQDTDGDDFVTFQTTDSAFQVHAGVDVTVGGTTASPAVTVGSSGAVSATGNITTNASIRAGSSTQPNGNLGKVLLDKTGIVTVTPATDRGDTDVVAIDVADPDDGSTKFVVYGDGTIVSANLAGSTTVPVEVDATGKLVRGSATTTDIWTESGAFIYPTDINDSLLIGGTTDGNSNIQLNNDGSGIFNVTSGSSVTLKLYRATDTANSGVLHIISDVGDDDKEIQSVFYADGSLEIGGDISNNNPNTTLSADGSADFAGGTTQIYASGHLAVETVATNQSTAIISATSENGEQFRVNVSGDASFAGPVTALSSATEAFVAERGDGTVYFKVQQANNSLLLGTSSQITLNGDDGSATFAGDITTTSLTGSDTVPVEVDSTGKLVRGSATSNDIWIENSAQIYPTDANDSLLIGGTLPGTPNIALNADGSGYLQQTLSVGYEDGDGVDGIGLVADSSSVAATNASIVARNKGVGGKLWRGTNTDYATETSVIYNDGRASFAGAVTVGDGASVSTTGINLFPEGYFYLARNDATTPFQRGYRTDTGAETYNILADGSASFAAGVGFGTGKLTPSNGYPVLVTSNNSGADNWGEIRISSANVTQPSISVNQWNGTDDYVNTVGINSDGSANFANKVSAGTDTTTTTGFSAKNNSTSNSAIVSKNSGTGDVGDVFRGLDSSGATTSNIRANGSASFVGSVTLPRIAAQPNGDGDAYIQAINQASGKTVANFFGNGDIALSDDLTSTTNIELKGSDGSATFGGVVQVNADADSAGFQVNNLDSKNTFTAYVDANKNGEVLVKDATGAPQIRLYGADGSATFNARVSGTVKTIPDGAWDMADSNYWTTAAATIVNPSNTEPGQTGVIYTTSAVTAWGTYFQFTGGSIPDVPANSVVPYYIPVQNVILIGTPAEAFS